MELEVYKTVVELVHDQLFIPSRLHPCPVCGTKMWRLKPDSIGTNATHLWCLNCKTSIILPLEALHARSRC